MIKKPFKKGAIVFVIDKRIERPIKGKIISSTVNFCFIKVHPKSYAPNGSLISLDGDSFDTIFVSTKSVIKKTDFLTSMCN